MSFFQRLSCRTWLILTGTLAPFSTTYAALGGDNLPDIEGSAATNGDIRGVIVDLLRFVLTFLALAAVVFIVIAGIRLIVSGGSDDQKDKAKKTILYVIIGLLIILFARVIVGFFTETLSTELD